MLNILSEWQKPLLHIQEFPGSLPDTHRLTTMTHTSLCYPVLSANNKCQIGSRLFSYTIFHSTVHVTFYPLSDLTASWNKQERGWEMKWYPQKHTSTVKCLISSLLTYLLTYLLTPWSRALLEKLTGFQIVEKFPAFYGTRRFITAFTSTHHLSLSWAVSSLPQEVTNAL
jgi:hypothetical protein